MQRQTRRHPLVLAALAGGVATALVLAVGTGLAGSGTAPSNTETPSISGTPRDGSILTADRGEWSGTSPITYAYGWQRCNSAGGSCSAIAGATSQSYTATSADVGSTLRVEVTATNAAGSGDATSEPTAVVAAAGTAPAGTKSPSISGSATQGSTLGADRGEWSGTTPITYAYRWQRCNSGGQSCDDVGGATAQTYTLVAADVGSRMRVRVTATNSQGSSSAASAATAVVAGGGGTGAIDVDNVSLPNRLVIERVSFDPNPVRSRNPITARIVVTDTSGRPVRDAIVFIRGIPERRIAPEPEARTDGSGVITFALEPTQLLPLQPGGRLTMFVRARKPDDRIIAGVTGTRLVSLRLAAPA